MIFLLYTTLVSGQESYVVDGQEYTLKSDVKGDLELLWNTIDNQYRYFLKKDAAITELKNTRSEGRFQEEYKDVLKSYTQDVSISTDNVNLTLPSLHDFVVNYNKMKNTNFSDNRRDVSLKLLLGVFAGVTNSVFTENVSNDSQLIAGLELELTDPSKLKRHAAVVEFKQTFEGSKHKYSASQFSLNYRFKFVKTPVLDMYANVKFASVSIYSKEIFVTRPSGVVVEKESGSYLSSPIALGIGVDYKIGEGYVTFGYRDFVGLNVDSNNHFPMEFTLGYKLML